MRGHQYERDAHQLKGPATTPPSPLVPPDGRPAHGQLLLPSLFRRMPRARPSREQFAHCPDQRSCWADRRSRRESGSPDICSIRSRCPSIPPTGLRRARRAGGPHAAERAKQMTFDLFDPILQHEFGRRRARRRRLWSRKQCSGMRRLPMLAVDPGRADGRSPKPTRRGQAR